MPNVPEITTIKQSEIPLLRTIAEETFIDTFADDNQPENIRAYVEKSFTLEQTTQEFNTTDSHFFFARIDPDIHSSIDHNIAGYLKLNYGEAQTEHDLQNSVEIERIYARPNHQGKGVGKALMQHSITQARHAGASWLWLGVWERNSHAIEFYKRQGFQPFGQHDFYMGSELQHDLMMKLNIQA